MAAWAAGEAAGGQEAVTSIDPSWPVLGRTDNATFYLADPRIIVVAPDEGCTDDEPTARQSVELQIAHWQAQGVRGATIVLMDRVVHQSKAARRVYQIEVNSQRFTVCGLVSSSVFGRAIASVFLGLSRPPLPTRMFGSLAQALQWARAQHDAPDGAHSEDGDAA